MTRYRARALAVASLSLGLFLPVRGWAASLTQVNRSDWTGSVTVPSYVQMYIYVPDKLATKPPIMVSSHSCGSTASGQIDNIPLSKAAADANGFILILPDNPGQNCWDVGTKPALTHDGGSDTQAVVQMVKYALTKYSGDAARVYAMGGSSGAMMTQALMAVYPDVFRAGSARAGVPAGCWADGYDGGQQWSNNCAGGNTTKTAQQWGDLVRAMYANYTGHRPRLQIMQGESDTTISYKNTAESIKEWTNVLALSTEPTSSDKGYKAASATYDRQFWQNKCGYVVFEAWSSPGGTHSMKYEEADILKFFGLDTAGGTDPEPDCTGTSGGTGGMGGMGAGGTGAGGRGAGGVGGMSAGGVSAGGAGGVSAGGMGVQGGSGGNAGGSAVAAGSGGITASAGSNGASAGSGLGGLQNVGGKPAAGVGGSSGGTSAGGAATGTGGRSSGGSSGNGSAGKASAGAAGDATAPDAAGCGCIVGGNTARHTYSTGMALGLALLAFRRRQRRARR